MFYLTTSFVALKDGLDISEHLGSIVDRISDFSQVMWRNKHLIEVRPTGDDCPTASGEIPLRFLELSSESVSIMLHLHDRHM